MRAPAILTEATERRRLIERNRELLASGTMDDASRAYREDLMARCAAWLAEHTAAIEAAEAELTAAKAARTAQRQANRTTPSTARPNPYADLPRIVYVTSRTDAGEYGAALCPHCGAEGRYIVYFRCEDGSERGAMAGCFKQFLRHPFADRAAALLTKRDDYAKKGWTLPTWDVAILEAIEAFADGTISEWQAKDQIADAQRRAANYRQRRVGRR